MTVSAASPSSASARAASCVGAYGFTITGLGSGTSTGLVALGDTEAWPSLHLTWQLGTLSRPAAGLIDDDHAVVLLVEGEYAELDRHLHTVVIHAASELDAHDLVHPYLTAPAAIMAQWHGRVALHAGGIVVDDGVWALLGEKGAGKTTMLTACRSRGLPVLADDLVVVAGGVCFAGPRTLDLRPETAERLDGSAPLVRVRDGERARLMLPPIAPELPFRGCVVLSEGESTEMAAVALGERLDVLERHVAMSPYVKEGVLDLLALPMWSLRRPKAWEHLPGAVDALVATVGR